MNPEPPPIADPHSTAPAPIQRTPRTRARSRAFVYLGVLFFVAGIIIMRRGSWSPDDLSWAGIMHVSLITLIGVGFVWLIALNFFVQAWLVWKRGQ